MKEVNITFEKILKAYLETKHPYVFLIGNNEENKSETNTTFDNEIKVDAFEYCENILLCSGEKVITKEEFEEIKRENEKWV